MSHFGTVHSLDERGMPNMFADNIGVSHIPVSNQMSFEFDNFGVSHQPASDSTLSAHNPEIPSLSTTLYDSQNISQLGNVQDNGLSSNQESQTHCDVPGPVVDKIQQEGLPESVAVEAPPETSTNADSPVIDIAINNVVCSFATKCHLNLRRIAMEGMHVIHKKEYGMVSMKLRNPYTTASIWSSGKITCTGATSEDESKRAARRFARTLQNLGFKTKVTNFRVVNVLGTCSLPFGINITSFSRQHPREASYEPELHPGVTYKLKEPKATLKVFSTGSITVTAPRVINVQLAIEHIFPLVYTHRKNKASLDAMDFEQARMYLTPANRKKRQLEERQNKLIRKRQRFDESDKEDWTDTEDELESDDSQY